MKTRTPAAGAPMMMTMQKASSFTRNGTSFKASRLPVTNAVELAALSDRVRMLTAKVEVLENACKKLLTPTSSTNNETSPPKTTLLRTTPLKELSSAKRLSRGDQQLEIIVDHPLAPAPRRGRPKGAKDKVKRAPGGRRAKGPKKQLNMAEKDTGTVIGVVPLQPRAISTNMDAVEASLRARFWQQKSAKVSVKTEIEDSSSDHIIPIHDRVPNLRFERPSP